jgi:hypothetical protein
MLRLAGFGMLVVSILGLAPVYSADITSVVDAKDKFGYINILGQIRAGDQIKFRAEVDRLIKGGNVLYKVNVFTAGGNVRAAMDIGDRIRALRATTAAPDTFINAPRGNVNCWMWSEFHGVVARNWPQSIITYNRHTKIGNADCECASACFLIWASGMTRSGNVVGVHRPYFDAAYFGNLSAGDAETQYHRMLIDYKSYLTRLDVPQGIIDRMFATGSKAIYFLNESELSLMKSVPFLEELTLARCGSSKARHVTHPDGSWTYTEDPVHVNCFRGVLKEILRKAADAYRATL